MTRSRKIKIALCVAAQLVGLAITTLASAQDKVCPAAATQPAHMTAGLTLDPKLGDYQPTAGVSGAFKSVGSDTMNNLMALWSESFQKCYPNVRFEIEGKGSGTAPPALIAGTATFAPMSRPMKAKEIDAFESKFGYKPVAIGAAIDMLAIYVHKDNPISGLTMAQVDAIFSKARKLGHPAEVKTWGDLGLAGQWAGKPISLYGRNSASGTYGFLKEHALGGGDYKDTVKEQPGSASVVQGVANDRYGIGYSGIGYKTADVKAVPLAVKADGQFVPADPQFAYSGAYPLSRLLYVYVNCKPGAELDPLRREFIRYFLSRQGQREVVKDGYIPVTAKMAEKSLSEIGPGSN